MGLGGNAYNRTPILLNHRSVRPMPDLPNTDHLVAISDRAGGPASLGTAVECPKRLTVMQLVPELESGGVERGTIEIAVALKAAGHRPVVVSGGGRMVAELEALGVQHITLPIGKKSLWTLRLVRTLRRLFVAQGVDIVHLRSRVPAWVGWLAWRRMDPATRPRLVTTVHGPYSTNAYSAVMLRGERVIAVSDMIVDYIRQNYPWVEPQRIHRIYRGVDPAAFPEGYQPGSAWLAQWRTQFPQLRNRWVLTLPGRITRWKGQLDLLEIVARLKAEGVPVLGHASSQTTVPDRDRGGDRRARPGGGRDPRRAAWRFARNHGGQRCGAVVVDRSGGLRSRQSGGADSWTPCARLCPRGRWRAAFSHVSGRSNQAAGY
jgi:hypothetical protein